ncbi:SURF1 family protein [Novosphingobium sp.]|uniref:SURF1 family protein n=1 Tax=Novosphingobium sp. TaxID=1874826 RepID=UPI003341ABB8
MRRPPVFATLLVLLAVATMIGFGMWQLRRLAWKQDILARYAAAEAMPAPLPIAGATMPANAAYRHVVWDCPAPGPDQVVGGSNAAGRSGWVHAVTCRHQADGVTTVVPVVIGWSLGIVPVQWAGGAIVGVAVPGPKSGVVLPAAGPTSHNLDWHIIADPPLAGLAANARPDPATIPNNHLSYAVQWFLFAATALIIYALALRRR